MAVSSSPRSTGQQVSLSDSSFKGQENTRVHNMQLICGLTCQSPHDHDQLVWHPTRALVTPYIPSSGCSSNSQTYII